jgi:hypothetical protein
MHGNSRPLGTQPSILVRKKIPKSCVGARGEAWRERP